MKTQNQKLNFSSQAVVELSDSNLNTIKGGSPVTDFLRAYLIAQTAGTWVDYGPLKK